jgi:hypothetical protein
MTGRSISLEAIDVPPGRRFREKSGFDSWPSLRLLMVLLAGTKIKLI